MTKSALATARIGDGVRATVDSVFAALVTAEVTCVFSQPRNSTMPLFEYFCEDCHGTQELLVGRTEKPACTKCGGKKMNKLMSTAAVRMSSGSSLPFASDCPPPEAGPCSPHCCRLPQ